MFPKSVLAFRTTYNLIFNDSLGKISYSCIEKMQYVNRWASTEKYV